MASKMDDFQPIVPNQGIVLQEDKPFYILCKPKLLPLKSITLQKLEKMQEEAMQKAKQQMNDESNSDGKQLPKSQFSMQD